MNTQDNKEPTQRSIHHTSTYFSQLAAVLEAVSSQGKKERPIGPEQKSTDSRPAPSTTLQSMGGGNGAPAYSTPFAQQQTQTYLTPVQKEIIKNAKKFQGTNLRYIVRICERFLESKDKNEKHYIKQTLLLSGVNLEEGQNNFTFDEKNYVKTIKYQKGFLQDARKEAINIALGILATPQKWSALGPTPKSFKRFTELYKEELPPLSPASTYAKALKNNLAALKTYLKEHGAEGLGPAICSFDSP